MPAANPAKRIEEIPAKASCLRRGTHAIDNAAISVGGVSTAIEIEPKSEGGYEIDTVRQLLTSATQLLELAQEELGRITAELNCHGERLARDGLG